MEVILIILTAIYGLLIAVCFILWRKLEASRSRISADSETITSLKEKCVVLKTNIEFAERQAQQLKRYQDEMARQNLIQQQTMMKQTETRFEVLANKIFSAHAAELQTRNDTNLNKLLNPLKEDIDRFRRDVTDFYSKEAAERFSLSERIKELIEANNNIGKEARELSTALRGNSKTQGDWGEMVLETILENSGLRKGEEFLVQEQSDEFGKAMRNESGQGLRPDVIVRYPGGKVMIIDSKVSLTAFVEYVNSESPEDQQRLAKAHLTSMIKHVNELSLKSYQDYVGKDRLDFVMMFVPNESAYSTAMRLDSSLWQKAYDKRVLIVSPTQLVASLKIVMQLWRHDRQTRNAIDIAERSGAMYDKFVGFISDMERIDKAIGSTRSAYDSAMRKLRDGTGSLISRAEKLRELGIKTAKRLPETDTSED